MNVLKRMAGLTVLALATFACGGGSMECQPEECGPMPMMPNVLCWDGSVGGPTGQCLRWADVCSWEIRECPPLPECTEEQCGSRPKMMNYLCSDGVTMAGPGDCERQASGECGWTIVHCPACTEEQCGSRPKMMNYLCSDGVTMAGPGACEPQASGECGWTIVHCPESVPTAR